MSEEYIQRRHESTKGWNNEEGKKQGIIGTAKHV